MGITDKFSLVCPYRALVTSKVCRSARASSSVTQVDRPHAAHRLAMGTTGDAGRSPLDLLDRFAGLLLRHGTILDGRGAALAAGLRQTGHIIYGFDSPFAPLEVSRYYKARPETYEGIDGLTLDAINRTNAPALFPRLGTPPKRVPTKPVSMVRGQIRHHALLLVSLAMSSR